MKDNKAMKYITLITGVLTLLLGIYTLVRPMRTFLTIGWILGILLFVNGIELVILSLSKEKKEIGGCILGVLEGLAGIILLFSGIQRFITDVMAAYLVGASILVYGIFQIVSGTKVYKTSKGKGILSIVCGVLSVIVSIISFTHPVLTMISAGYMIAFLLLFQFADLLTDKLKARQNIDRTQSIMLCDLLCHVHRYNGFDHNRICGHFMVLLTLVANIIQQQGLS